MKLLTRTIGLTRSGVCCMPTRPPHAHFTATPGQVCSLSATLQCNPVRRRNNNAHIPRLAGRPATNLQSCLRQPCLKITLTGQPPVGMTSHFSAPCAGNNVTRQHTRERCPWRMRQERPNCRTDECPACPPSLHPAPPGKPTSKGLRHETAADRVVTPVCLGLQ